MKIYSIKEIIKATNYFLNSETKHTNSNKENIKKKEIKLSTKVKNIVQDPNKVFLKKKNNQNKEKSSSLTVDRSLITKNEINSFNYKIKIKTEVKDHMINELYLFLKKKIKKNTLKLIIDEQLEIKNLKNRINLLKKIEDELKNNYYVLKNNYEIILKIKENLEVNNEKLNNENKELKTNNNKLHNDLNEVLIETRDLIMKIKN